MQYIGFLAQAGEKPFNTYFTSKDLRLLKAMLTQDLPRNWRKIDIAVIYADDGLRISYLVDGEWVDG